MATPVVDPNIEALDPEIRNLRKAQASETLGAVSRVLTGRPAPPRPDYTDQRIKLISLLDNLRKMETDLRAEQEKTGRVSLATQATLLKALAGLGEANIGAVSDVQVAKLNSIADRLTDLTDQIDRRGIRQPEDLKEAAITSLNALGAYAKDGRVNPGAEAAFAAEVLKGIRSIDTTNPVDAGLPAAYASEVERRYGVNLADFLVGPGQAANLAPATISAIASTLDRADTAQAQNARTELELSRQFDELRTKELGAMTLEPGSFLARAVNQYNAMTGQGPVEEAAPPPPVTASKEEKQAYLQSISPNLSLSEDGKNVVVTSDDGTQTRRMAYDTVAQMGTPGTQRLAGVKMTDFLDQQEKYVLKELERLENASDLESVRIRRQILQSPELATWAEQNGYAGFRPEQQFKALLDARRVEVGEQNRAFRAQRDADILSREGAPIRKAGAAIRDLFRRPEAKEAARSGRDSADLTTGAATPDTKTQNTGATESDPKALEPATRETASMARLGEGAAGIMPIDVEGERQRADAEAEAKTQKMTAESAARPERTLPADTAFEEGLKRGRNERTVQRTLSNPAFSDIAEQYKSIQSFKGTDPGAYATALSGIAREVERRMAAPRGEITAGEAELADDARPTLLEGFGRVGRAMPEEAQAAGRAQYLEAQAKAGAPPVIPPGRRGTLTGPSQEAVDAFNATLPPVDTTDVPEPPAEPPVEEGVDMMPVEEGTALASVDVPEATLAAETGGAGRSARGTLRSLLASAKEGEAAAPTPEGAAAPPGSGQASAGQRAAGGTPLPMFESFGAEAATQAAATAMGQAQSAEEQLRARRKALLMGTSMPA